eukprot:3923014-Amphidinium_carterae.1
MGRFDANLGKQFVCTAAKLCPLSCAFKHLLLGGGSLALSQCSCFMCQATRASEKVRTRCAGSGCGDQSCSNDPTSAPHGWRAHRSCSQHNASGTGRTNPSTQGACAHDPPRWWKNGHVMESVPDTTLCSCQLVYTMLGFRSSTCTTVAFTGSTSLDTCNRSRGGMQHDADYDVEEAVTAQKEEPTELEEPTNVTTDAPTDGATGMQVDEGNPLDEEAPAAVNPAEQEVRAAQPGETDDVATHVVLQEPVAVQQEQAPYDPEKRALELSGRLHLGMELDDARVLPRGEPTKQFTIEWGVAVGTVRKAAEALWASLECYAKSRSFLWNASWHLDFLPTAQAAVEAKNVLYALWKQDGQDWDRTRETIGRCRDEFVRLTTLLDPVWQALRVLVAKNRIKQRLAWETLLKASYLPTKEDYDKMDKDDWWMMKWNTQDWGQPKPKDANAGSSGDDQQSKQRTKGNKQGPRDSEPVVETPDTGGAASSGTQQQLNI